METLVKQKNATYWLKKNLRDHGFAEKRDFALLLPLWWTDECEADPLCIRHLALHVAGFFDLTFREALALVSGPVPDFKLPSPPGLHLKVVKGSRRFLGASMWKLRNYAYVLQRGFRYALPRFCRGEASTPVESALEIRREILKNSAYVDYRSLRDYCWKHGIIVAYCRGVKSGGLHGAAIPGQEAHAHPVIFLCSGDCTGRQVFRLAHELGHIMLGHGTCCRCEDESTGEEEETQADAFATVLLKGAPPLPAIPLAVSSACRRSLQAEGRRLLIAQEVLALFLAEEETRTKRISRSDAHRIVQSLYPSDGRAFIKECQIDLRKRMKHGDFDEDDAVSVDLFSGYSSAVQ